MNSARLVSLSAVLLLALAPGCTKSSGSSVPFGRGLPHVAASPAIAKQEREMFVRLNQDRKERDLPALSYDAKLADVGRFHSADMRDHRFFDHHSPTSGSLDDRLNAAGYLFLNARENLSEAPDVQSGEDALLRSPGHLANIVATDTTHVGIGIVAGGVMDPKNLTITQVFARPGREESPAQARKAIVDRIRAERAREGVPPAQPHPLLDELASAHIGELDAETSESRLREVGKRVVSALAARKNTGMGGVVAGAQLLPDSAQLSVPDSLLAPGNTRFGLAVRTVAGPGGRPLLQVLLLVAKPAQ